MYVVLGASGNTGAVVARKLLEKGEKVRAVGRDASKLSALARLGADVDVADLSDSAGLTKIFAGAQGAYLLIPPQIQAPDFLAAADSISSSIADAVRDSGVSHALANTAVLFARALIFRLVTLRAQHWTVRHLRLPYKLYLSAKRSGKTPLPSVIGTLLH